jgi:hypothetical protein
MTPGGNRSLPDLVSDSFEQLGKLVSNEVELAKAEITSKAKQAGIAIAMIGAAAVLAIPALVLILFGAAAGLIKIGLAEPWAYLAVGLATAIGGGVLAMAGVGRLSAEALAPHETMHQLKRDKIAAKEMVK